MNTGWAAMAVAAFGIVLCSSVPLPARAASGSDATAAPAVEGDLIAVGRDVGVREPIEGDVAVAGSKVTVAAAVDGYVMAAGAEVSVQGEVGDDLWAAGRQVSVSADVGDNARLAGASVLVQPQAHVGRNALIAGRVVEVRGPVERDLRVNAAQLLLASEVGGSVEARAGSVKLEPGALIRGDLIAYGPSPPEVSPESRVLGRIQYHAEGGEGGEAASFAWRWLFAFLALLVLGAATIVVSARWGERVAAEIGRRFGASLLSGFVALIVVPLLVALLAVTVVGIPLAVLVIALYAVVLLLSGVFVSLRLGDWMLGKAGRPRASPYAQLAAGALLVSLLAALPWIGWIAWLLVPVIGLGAILLERRDAWRRRSTGAPA